MYYLKLSRKIHFDIYKILFMLSVLSSLFLAMAKTSTAAAPDRGYAYTEATLCASAAVFFCEDFEKNPANGKGSVVLTGTTGDTCEWRNPALWNRKTFGGKNYMNTGLLCKNALGGRNRNPFEPIPNGPTSGTNNTVWHVAKESKYDYPDIFTGVKTGVGTGNVLGGGWLYPVTDNCIVTATNPGASNCNTPQLQTDCKSVLGTACREMYIRYQIYYSNDFGWPPKLDVKNWFVLPYWFFDSPSAEYEIGTMLHYGTNCNGNHYSGRAMTLRFGTNFKQWPKNDENCPASQIGVPTEGKVFLQGTGKWYTIEMFLKLDTKPSINDGEMKLWVDGVLVYDNIRDSKVLDMCSITCMPFGRQFISAYMNDRAQGGFVQMDNFVMSRAPIGQPSGGGSSQPSTDTTPPAAPGGLTIK